MADRPNFVSLILIGAFVAPFSLGLLGALRSITPPAEPPPNLVIPTVAIPLETLPAAPELSPNLTIPVVIKPVPPPPPYRSEYADLSEGRKTVDKDGGGILTVSPDGRVAKFQGVIGLGFATLIEHMPDTVRLLVMESVGGNAIQAGAAGQKIRRRGIITYVPDYCHSACTFVFISGIQRVVNASASMMVHGPVPGALKSSDEMANYYTPEAAAEVETRIKEWRGLGVSARIANMQRLPRKNHERFVTGLEAVEGNLATMNDAPGVLRSLIADWTPRPYLRGQFGEFRELPAKHRPPEGIDLDVACDPFFGSDKARNVWRRYVCPRLSGDGMNHFRYDGLPETVVSSTQG